MHGMRQQTAPGCERACVPYANGMLHNASGETIGDGQPPPPPADVRCLLLLR